MSGPKHYLALCCIVRDEDPFLREWLAYHALLGVERFYIYDNMSARPIRQSLGFLAAHPGLFIRRVHGDRMQIPVYQDCLDTFGADCRWIGFIDLDEFVLPVRDADLRPLLAEFEAYAGLGLTWRLFGSSGHLKRPEGPVIANYTEAFAVQESHQIKCFVDPARTRLAHGPHTFIHSAGGYCVNEDHYPIPPQSACTFSRGRLGRVHHYFVRSQQDFEDKLRRGRPDGGEAHEYIMFYEAAARACVKDESMLRFLPALEKALREEKLPEGLPLPDTDAEFEVFMEAALGLAGSHGPEAAQICLCRAVLRHQDRPELWLLRALLAKQAGKPEREDHFLRQALMRGGLETTYRELAALFRQRGENDLAQGVETILRRYPEYWE